MTSSAPSSRARAAFSSVPVVVITAKELTEEDHVRLNGGVERIVQKGSRDRFLSEVRDLVALHAAPAGPTGAVGGSAA